MSVSYERWAMERLKCRKKCRVERAMSCVPLRDDPICRACFESDRGKDENPAEEGRRSWET
jgi:hypothetical protein